VGVLVSRGNEAEHYGEDISVAGGNSGGMIPITLTAYTSYTLNLGTNSSISDGATTIATNSTNVALGGGKAIVYGNDQDRDGADNTFGKGVGGIRSAGSVLGASGSGYGAGGGGGFARGWPCGGGGGFDPNAYYGLTPPITGVPISNRIPSGPVGAAKPGVLFLELSSTTKKRTTTTTTQPTTTTTTTHATTTTTTTLPPWHQAVVKVNGAHISPVHSTDTTAHFQILDSTLVSSTIECSGVLVSRGNDAPDPRSATSCPGGNSGGMIPITLTANTSYTLNLGMTSSISNGNTTIDTGSMNVALGGNQDANGDNNAFGKGMGGARAGGSVVANSGSGYGAGGGGGTRLSIWPSGGGGGFDPNAYYGITPPITIPESDKNAKTIDNLQIGVGKPPVLFLRLYKP
jgi:hypothetical protein